MDKMVRWLLIHQLINNPLPWTVDRDWTYEVKASNGVVIAKCPTHAEAQEIIKAAETIKRELDSIDAESIIACAD